MQKIHALIILILIVGILYWLTLTTSSTIKNNVEYFEILQGINMTLGTKKYKEKYKYQKKSKRNKKIPSWNKENFSNDSFIEVQGNLVRRELVPSNYAEKKFSFLDGKTKILSTLDQHNAPQPYNYYFGT